MSKLMPFPCAPFAEIVASEPAALARIVAEFPDAVRAAALDGLFAAGHPVIAGMGASHAAAAPLVVDLTRAGVAARRSDCSDMPMPGPDPVLALSQSGRSPETVAAVEAAPAGARYSLTNASTSPVADAADVALSLGDARDSLVSSVGFTGLVVGGGIVADAWIGLSRPWGDLSARVMETVEQAIPVVADFVSAAAGAGAIDVVGAASALGAAENGALLLREGLGLPATAMQTRMYLHGPVVPGRAVPRVLIGGAREARLATELPDGTPVLFIDIEDVPAAPSLTVNAPASDAATATVLAATVMQQLLISLAEARGHRIPRKIEEFPATDDIKVGPLRSAEHA